VHAVAVVTCPARSRCGAHLLQMWPFMARKPLCIRQHGPFMARTRPRHGRPASPAVGCQRVQDSQESGTLLCKGLERGRNVLVTLVGRLDQRRGIDRPQRRRVGGDHRRDAVSPHVSTHAQMGQHLTGRPPPVRWGGMQVRWFQIGRQGGDTRRRFCKQGRHLLTREYRPGQTTSPSAQIPRGRHWSGGARLIVVRARPGCWPRGRARGRRCGPPGG